MSQAGIESQQVSLFAQSAQQSLFSALAQPSLEHPHPIFLTVANTPLAEAVFTVVDLETTGLNARKNAITEIAALQYKNAETLNRFVTLVRPNEAIPEEIEHLTGITNEMVKNAPALVMALSDMASAIGDAPYIVGHNISFDIGFLTEKFHQNGMGLLAERVSLQRAFCTKVLAQKAMPGLPSYEGIVVATSCGVKNPNPHRAENDVKMSAEILFSLIQRIQQAHADVKTVADLMAFQGPLH